MPETPTPCVNGQLLPAQGARSISSFEPAAKMFGCLASTASAGSFCLFCGKGVGGLPTVTSVSPPAAETGMASDNTPTMASTDRRRMLHFAPELLLSARTKLYPFNAILLFLL